MKKDIGSIETAECHSMNAYGETPIKQAPIAVLETVLEQSTNSFNAVPQQYLHYHRNIETIEAVLNDIEFSDKFLLFVNQSADLYYIQVGLIGRENYPPSSETRSDKIVYGRKWVIEKHMPTSEIVQTAFLAIKKAREHELREYFVLRLMQSNGTVAGKCTPFNSHVDLPLLAMNQHYVNKAPEHISEAGLRRLLANVSLADYHFELINLQSRTLGEQKQYMIDIAIVDGSLLPAEGSLLQAKGSCSETAGSSKQASQSSINNYFPELMNAQFTLLTTQLDSSTVLHELMEKVLQLSDEYVAENFTFNGFARFSKKNDVRGIAEFSRSTRVFCKQKKSEIFTQLFQTMTHDIDAARAPNYAMHNDSSLGDKQREVIDAYEALEGYLPISCTSSGNAHEL